VEGDTKYIDIKEKRGILWMSWTLWQNFET